MEDLIKQLRFLARMMDAAHIRDNENDVEYFIEKIDQVMEEAFEAGATPEQVDEALGIN